MWRHRSIDGGVGKHVVTANAPWQCAVEVTESWSPRDGVAAGMGDDLIMWSFVDRVVNAVYHVTVGTVIVLVHVGLADRRRRLDAAESTGRRDLLPRPS